MSWNNPAGMSPIAEDGAGRAAAAFGIDEALANMQDANIEQLAVSMLEQRDKLNEQLQKAHFASEAAEEKTRAAERERDSLRRQLELQTQHMHAVGG